MSSLLFGLALSGCSSAYHAAIVSGRTSKAEQSGATTVSNDS